jgi:hypothetical protein
MPGYANRTIRLAFPELTEEGDPEVFVTIRNPKILPGHEITVRDVTDEQLKADPAANFFAQYDLVARLVTDWLVYDATTEDAQPLELPADEHKVAKLPRQIAAKIISLVVEAQNPGAGD